MMVSMSYGSHPGRLDELLESFGPGRQTGVRLLDERENRAVEGDSLDLLPQTSWGTIEWAGVPLLEQRAVRDGAHEIGQFSRLVAEYIPAESRVVVIWGNLVVPSIELPVELVLENSEEVLATSHDLWVYAPEEQLVVEYFHEGRVTVARVPPRA